MKRDTNAARTLLLWTVGLLVVACLLASASRTSGAGADLAALDQAAAAAREPEIPELYAPPTSYTNPRRVRVGDPRVSPVEAEARGLALRMRSVLSARIPGSTPRTVEDEARRRDVDGLARVLVEWSEARAGRGAWLPLSREKAPAFLAAVAFHESSWRWRSERLRGSRGERCAMQVHPRVLELGHFDPAAVSRDVGRCLDASAWLMERCARICGEEPAEAWVGCYASGRCGWAPAVVGERLATARLLLGP